MYIQIEIKKDSSVLTCWVEKNKKLKIGSKIKLEDGNWYTIENIYKTEIENPDVRNQINELRE
jgi:hypothetical protein